MNESRQTDQAVIISKTLVAKPKFRNTVMVDIKIAYPQAAVAGCAAASMSISAFYRERAQRYYNAALHGLYPKAMKDYISGLKSKVPFRTYAAAAAYEVPYNADGLLSIYTDAYEFSGGAHGDTVRLAETWNLRTGKRLQLPDLFGGSYRAAIYNGVVSQISAQIANGGSYFEEYRKNVFRYLDEANFYLTPEGLAVYFPPVTLAPHSSGIAAFVIPYGELGGLHPIAGLP